MIEDFPAEYTPLLASISTTIKNSEISEKLSETEVRELAERIVLCESIRESICKQFKYAHLEADLARVWGALRWLSDQATAYERQIEELVPKVPDRYVVWTKIYPSRLILNERFGVNLDEARGRQDQNRN